VSKNAVEVVQQLDAIPYRIDGAGPFDSQLVIDVGHDRRHFALSLLVARGSNAHPPFVLRTHVSTKADHQFESLNAKVLSDQIVQLVERVLPHRSDPLRSILVIRDGRFCGQETDGVLAAMEELRRKGKLTAEGRVDLIDLRKDTLKGLRMWEVSSAERSSSATAEPIREIHTRQVRSTRQHGGKTRGYGVAPNRVTPGETPFDGRSALSIANPLEGKAIQLGTDQLLIATTGSATLTQGTAEPLLLISNGYCSDILQAGESVFATSQLNWSSPKVAQRLPMPLKRTDEQLRARDAQEIRRFE
jgi:hypothetical protein